MFFFLLVYLALVIIRPQDYPAIAENPGPPLQSIALLAAAGLWVFSARKSFSAPQYLLIPCFLVVAMFSKVVNGWPGGALAQLLLRHKTAKLAFQWRYWLAVLLNVAALFALAWLMRPTPFA